MAETNGGVWANGVFSPLLIALTMLGGMSAIIVPMRNELTAHQLQIDKAVALAERTGQRADDKWSEYQQGKIPSSAEPKLAEMNQKFVEVETQFRAFKERMIENETLMTTRSNTNTRHIEDLEVEATAAREARGRHDERLHQLERRLGPGAP